MKIALPILAILWLLLGPWPIPEVFGDTDAVPEYRQATLANLEAFKPAAGNGELRVGIGKTEITAVPGQPLMGFTNRKPLASTGVHSPCYAKALTLQCGAVQATIVTLDLFILLPELTAAVIRASGLPADELYFTVSHTHSGPGGWARGGIYEIIYGSMEERWLTELAERIAAAIKQSRTDLIPASMCYRRAETPGFLENRTYKDERPAREIAEALVFRRKDAADKLIAAFMTYSAHATMVRREEHRCSADYPGFWRDAWENTHGGEAMFAAGCIGDARCSGNFTAETLGEKLNTVLTAAAETPVDVQELVRLRIPVKPPAARLPCGKRWRWLPLFIPMLFPEMTYVSGLRLGNTVLVGWPGDVAGELAPELEKYAATQGLRVMLTSFNGDWRCYFTTKDTYTQRDAYAVRMGFLGPDAGGYFTAVSQRLLDKLTETSGKTRQP